MFKSLKLLVVVAVGIAMLMSNTFGITDKVKDLAKHVIKSADDKAPSLVSDKLKDCQEKKHQAFTGLKKSILDAEQNAELIRELQQQEQNLFAAKKAEQDKLESLVGKILDAKTELKSGKNAKADKPASNKRASWIHVGFFTKLMGCKLKSKPIELNLMNGDLRLKGNGRLVKNVESVSWVDESFRDVWLNLQH